METQVFSCLNCGKAFPLPELELACRPENVLNSRGHLVAGVHHGRACDERHPFPGDEGA